MKRLQIYLTDEALQLVEDQLKLANENFKSGSINYSDLITEMVLSSKVDIKALQLKKTDLRRSLRVLALQPDLDVDTVIKHLSELRQRALKKVARSTAQQEAFE